MVFIPHHIFVTADPAGEQARPASWMLMAHGIYGSGANWRTFARKLAQRRPEWGIVLVDLRQHGHSQGAPPPHTVAAAAADLQRLSGQLAGAGKVVRAVSGHSFGGKVMLSYRAGAGAELEQTWILDASPSAHPDALSGSGAAVVAVLRMLGRLPASFASREAFLAHVEGEGFPAPLAQWLAMSLERRDDGRYVSWLDAAAMEALLGDYYELDSWPYVSAGPGELQVVIAGRSDAVDAAARERFAELERAGLVHVSHIADSGHWLHIEAPGPLLELMAARLPGG